MLHIAGYKQIQYRFRISGEFACKWYFDRSVEYRYEFQHHMYRSRRQSICCHKSDGTSADSEHNGNAISGSFWWFDHSELAGYECKYLRYIKGWYAVAFGKFACGCKRNTYCARICAGLEHYEPNRIYYNLYCTLGYCYCYHCVIKRDCEPHNEIRHLLINSQEF